MFESYLVRNGDSQQCEHQWNDNNDSSRLSWDVLDGDYDESYDNTRTGYTWGSSRYESRSSSYDNGNWQQRDSDNTWSSSLPSELTDSPVWNKDQTIKPVQRTKVIEQGDEICFSKQPVKTCPRNTYPVQYKDQEQKVVYSCLSRNDIRSEIYHRRSSQHRVVSEVESLSSSFTETEIVPKTCRFY
jgi:hypothetical protein